MKDFSLLQNGLLFVLLNWSVFNWKSFLRLIKRTNPEEHSFINSILFLLIACHLSFLVHFTKFRTNVIKSFIEVFQKYLKFPRTKELFQLLQGVYGSELQFVHTSNIQSSVAGDPYKWKVHRTTSRMNIKITKPRQLPSIQPGKFGIITQGKKVPSVLICG